MQFNPSDYQYTPLFCEENIWLLADSLNTRGFKQEDMSVLFFSNPNRTVAIFNQKRGQQDMPMIWDYHVVLMAKLAKDYYIFDFDSRLSFPSRLTHYLNQSFQVLMNSEEQLTPLIRIISSGDYLHHFSSDRRHMTGLISPQQFPNYPCIKSANQMTAISLEQYWDSQLELPDNSRVYSLASFLQEFSIYNS